MATHASHDLVKEEEEDEEEEEESSSNEQSEAKEDVVSEYSSYDEDKIDSRLEQLAADDPYFIPADTLKLFYLRAKDRYMKYKLSYTRKAQALPPSARETQKLTSLHYKYSAVKGKYFDSIDWDEEDWW